MTLVGQPEPSPALRQAYQLLADGKREDAIALVKQAAIDAKKQHGSGSHPLALAYGDMARLHLRAGEIERAAKEFQHAGSGPMPSDPQERRDRLAFLLGFGTALGELHKLPEAEKVLRQCLAYSRNIHGGRSAAAAVAQVPLADVLLMAGKTDEAAKLAKDAYNALWELGDKLFAATVGTHAETLQAIGKANNLFNDLNDLPDELVTAAVAHTLTRAGKGDIARMRAVLADLLGFVDKKFGDGHEITCDTLAAIVHHEAAAGDQANETTRRTAVRRSVWSYAVRRVPGGLLANLEVGFEPGGGLHLAPQLTRTPDPAEREKLETVLNQAIDDLYARPHLRP